jgi:hypothetical protein
MKEELAKAKKEQSRQGMTWNDISMSKIQVTAKLDNLVLRREFERIIHTDQVTAVFDVRGALLLSETTLVNQRLLRYVIPGCYIHNCAPQLQQKIWPSFRRSILRRNLAAYLCEACSKDDVEAESKDIKYGRTPLSFLAQFYATIFSETVVDEMIH